MMSEGVRREQMLRIGRRPKVRAVLMLLVALGLSLAGIGSAPLAAQGTARGQIAFFAQANLFLLDLTTNDIRQLTEDGINDSPTWSPDGQWLAFAWRGQ